MTRPSPDSVERFRRDLSALAPERRTVAVAVSGGPDSLALLLLAEAAFPGRTHAATVDHCLRAESAGEAAFVAELCAGLGVPHRILSVTVAAGSTGVQAAARDARYAALAGWMAGADLPVLLTGHHADDQAETLVMRLLRGSGVGGLAGIRAARPLPQAGAGALLCRPLLSWRRAELAEIVRSADLTAVADPSNADERYDRPRIRRLLAEAPWLDPLPLARSAAALAEAEEALGFAAERLFDERTARIGDRLVVQPCGLPGELLRRIVVKCLGTVAPGAAPRGDQVSVLIAALAAGETVTLAGVKCVGGDRWRFEAAAARTR